MPVRTGKEYLEQINALKSNIWIEGKKVEGNISEHLAFKGVMESQGKLYDMQHKAEYANQLTYRSPVTGNRVGISYLKPETKEDLELRRLQSQIWAKSSGGMLGRSPDYMNTVITAFASAAEIFSLQDSNYTANMQNLYNEAMEKDLCFTHTFINPQVNRSSYYQENFSEVISAQTTDIQSDGIVINGARLLATQGGITDEILVFPASGAAKNEELAYGYSIPSNTKGLKFISRESFRYKENPFDHPLGSRFEELDTIVVFKDVWVPKERILFYRNLEIASKIYTDSCFTPLTMHQVNSRRVIKMEFVLGVAQKMIDCIQIGEYQHIHEKISEIMVGLESLKALLLFSEMNAKMDRFGVMVPDINSLSSAAMLFTKLYPRCMDILQLIGASGLASIPVDADFASENKEDLDRYLQGAIVSGKEKVKVFRLAWDLSMSAFGTRQTLYERYFFGDPVRLASGHYISYAREDCLKLINQFLEEY